MRGGGVALILLAIGAASPPVCGQYQPPAQRLNLSAVEARTWSDGADSIVLLDQGVRIDLGDGILTADQAVLWLRATEPSRPQLYQVQIALLGHATAQYGQTRRDGPNLLVNTQVEAQVRVAAQRRLSGPLTDAPVYQQALALRRQPDAAIGVADKQKLSPFVDRTAALAATAPRAVPVRLQFASLQTLSDQQGKIAAVLGGPILIMATSPKGDLVELQAQHAVLFTRLNNLRQAQQGKDALGNAATAVYLEGDVRINYTPADPRKGQQQLQTERAYYDLVNHRAILTDAVLHAVDPVHQVPIMLRAAKLQQLSAGEFEGRDVVLSTSGFATPSLAIAAKKAYVRQVYNADDDGYLNRFRVNDASFELWGLPFFYWPYAAGSFSDRGLPLRKLQVENTNRFGFGVRTQWDLPQLAGRSAPPDLDLTLQADYLAKRGPAGGVDADYGGGFLTEVTRDPWNFQGSFRSYLIDDRGQDEFGVGRLDVDPPQSLRGRVQWEHQHFFPNDWQVQARLGWVSDATFLEEYFPNQWRQSQPLDSSVYFKRQRDTEAFTLLVSAQPNHFVTSSDLVQEQFEVQRLPELGYHRIGDALLDDQLTFYSDNSYARLAAQRSRSSLLRQGYPYYLSPGLASIGQTGLDSEPFDRADFRQEIDYPFSAGQFKVVPYVMGRYTSWSATPGGGGSDRLYSATGVRMTTAFWKIDEAAQSDLLDIHRLRHVIEPELHLYGSGQTQERTRVYWYDEPVDEISDFAAAQIALRQRWQTKRGGPGAWRSVDVFSLNVEGNFFTNQPPAAERRPEAFRGLFFDSLPEASIPRSSINSDGAWRISDSTSLFADAQWNLDKRTLATSAIGFAVRRDPRVSYYATLRYIDELNSSILAVAASYELSTKYTLTGAQSFDFGNDNTVSSNLGILRRFDSFAMLLSVSYDQTTGVSGVAINVLPAFYQPR